MSSRDTANVLWFNELHREDVNLVGGKSSSLGEMTSSMDVPSAIWFCHNRTRISVLYASDKIKR
jgi:phosphoenolpyruvate synthase/pyruvate phosphate dikinase